MLNLTSVEKNRLLQAIDRIVDSLEAISKDVKKLSNPMYMVNVEEKKDTATPTETSYTVAARQWRGNREKE